MENEVVFLESLLYYEWAHRAQCPWFQGFIISRSLLLRITLAPNLFFCLMGIDKRLIYLRHFITFSFCWTQLRFFRLRTIKRHFFNKGSWIYLIPSSWLAAWMPNFLNEMILLSHAYCDVRVLRWCSYSQITLFWLNAFAQAIPKWLPRLLMFNHLFNILLAWAYFFFIRSRDACGGQRHLNAELFPSGQFRDWTMS